jgi:photosystem II stability/assembly factor-like uncharacterized protein
LVVAGALLGCGGGGGGGSGTSSNVGGGETSTGIQITAQPADQVVATGNAAVFSVSAACPSACQVQWQVRQVGDVYADIADANSPTLTITSAAVDQSGTLIRAKVASGNAITFSRVATLTVGDGPSILAHPAHQSVTSGQLTQLSVVASGGELGYQWQKKSPGSPDSAFADIAGATFANYSFTASINDNGSAFRVLVRNSYGAIASSSAAIEVANIVSLPVITLEPADVKIGEGGKATLSVAANGPNITYQWQIRSPAGAMFVDIGSATSSSYTTSTLTNFDNGTQFRVIVSNQAGSVISLTAHLTVDLGLLTWTQVTPIPSSPSNFSSGYFTDADNGVLVGQAGVVSTSDGGISWATRSGDLPGSATSVYFVDRLNGWLVSNAGTFTYSTGPGSWVMLLLWGGVSKTTDGGNTWQSMNPIQENVVGPFSNFKDVFFTDINTGWIVGNGGQIYKTTNSGANWLKQDSTTSATLTRVLFPGSQHGVVLGRDDQTYQLFLLSTNDGGTTWTRSNLATLSSTDYSITVTDMGFVTDQRGWVSLGKCVLGTVNGGTSWAVTGCIDENIVAILPTSADTIYIKSDTESLYVSTDGGATFAKRIAATGTRYISFQRLFKSSANRLWIAEGGTLPFARPPRYVDLP